MDRAATLSRANPTFLKPMPAEQLPTQKPSPLILERFRALVKLRDGDGLSPLGSAAIVRIYDSLLSELTFNSKPIITDLTIIAGEQAAHAEGIAGAICARIIEAPIDQKLPSLYLLDSIVKNIGKQYVGHFSSRLPEVFCEAYRQVEPSMYRSMHHLFRTWSTVFPSHVLRQIETELRFSSTNQTQSGIGSTSVRSPESPRSFHGIHVNPKYVRQLDPSEVDSVGQQRLTSAGQYVDPSHSLTTEKQRSFPSDIDDFGVRNSPREFEKSSPSRSAFELGHGRLVSQRKYYSEDVLPRQETSTSSSVINEREHQNLRALIDAYGNDERESSTRNKPVAVDRLCNNKVASMSWQDTEEQEFNWEDMSPTLADGSRRNESIPFGRYKIPAENDISRRWPRQAQLPLVDESTLAANACTPLDGDRGLMKLPVLRGDMNPSMASRYALEGSQDSQHINRGTIRNFSTAFSASEELRNVEARYANPALSQLPLLNSVSPAMSQKSSMMSKDPLVFPNRQSGVLPLSQSNQMQAIPLASQLLHQKGQNIFQSPVSTSFRGPTPTINYGPISQGTPGAIPLGPLNLLHAANTRVPFSNIASSSFHSLRGPATPLHVVPPVPSMSTLPISQVSGNQLAGGPYSGLISNLLAQGFITAANQAPVQDLIGLDFDVDNLKVRHESAIRGLYADLPRQCTTCGLRFRSQDEHSSHMDWHVTKNRMTKNRKHKASRKWFVSSSMWLSGAEALGAEAVPGFLPVEMVEEKKSDEEMAVPADEDQNACALCGEKFDDFYSDETEEWMYKEAVYLNAPPDGSTAGLDRSQLGPIVHAKCRSESSSAPSEKFRQQGGSIEEVSQRRRLQI